MAKTKKASAPKKIAPEPMASSMMACSHNVSLGRCWMCWLFKSLIALFCAFIVLWIGFCCGILRSQSFQYKTDPALGALLQKGRFCSPQVNSMSRTMSDTSLNNVMGSGLASLEAKSGVDFDREFLIQMIMHHADGVDMAKQALAKSENVEIKKLAQQIIDTQSAEIEKMQELNK